MAEPKYIRFVECERNPMRKTLKWQVQNKRSGDVLGIIGWYPTWRQYCFEPWESTVHSAGCLIDIAVFIDQRNVAHKAKSERDMLEAGNWPRGK